MSVHVTMLPATIPPRLQDEDISRVRKFDDRGGDNPAVFRFSLHPTGAVVIWRLVNDVVTVEIVIGPAAWEDVQGDTYKATP